MCQGPFLRSFTPPTTWPTPLTTTVMQKRKAQNRAAQRAFRERKEKHLKDLETKVDELTKASEAANNENSKLRAQVERMTVELNQYKQKMTFNSSTKSSPRDKNPFGESALNHLNDVSFQFNFPKFGVLPGAHQNPQQSALNKQQRSVSQPISPQQALSPAKSQSSGHASGAGLPNQQSQDAQQKDDVGKFTGVFTPSMSSSARNGSGASVDSANYSAGGATSSPSASSHSNMGASSSCGTSPEPSTQSPAGSKPIDTMTTIGEEQTAPASEPFAQFSNINFGNSTNFDWLAQQQGGSFDPQIFGDYREPQDNILSNPSFDDFFNDALDADFFTPYNVAASPNFSRDGSNNASASIANNSNATSNDAGNASNKKSLIDQIDAQKNDFDDTMKPKDTTHCSAIWYVSPPVFLLGATEEAVLTISNRDKLQSCPKAQSGDFDLDGLCSELTKKAKCSGTGPIVGEQDFDDILKKYMGKDVSPDCFAHTLGVSITKD